MPYLLLRLLLPALLLVASGSPRNDAPPTLAERLGYAADAKLLIIHADDLGVAHSVNQASIDALATGRVNSASVMVPCPWFPEIAAYARAHPDLDLGLHLTLTSEWKHFRWDAVTPRTLTPTLHDSAGFLHATSEAVREADAAEAEREIRAQVERALAFGMQPTHLDSHMGALFQSNALFAAYLRVADDYGIPALIPRAVTQSPELAAVVPDDAVLVDQIVIASPAVPADDWDAFYTQTIERLEPGLTEIIIHLAYDDAEMQAITVDHPDYGAAWRQRDFEVFTHPSLDSLLAANDVHLITWREIGERLMHESR